VAWIRGLRTQDMEVVDEKVIGETIYVYRAMQLESRTVAWMCTKHTSEVTALTIVRGLVPAAVVRWVRG